MLWGGRRERQRALARRPARRYRCRVAATEHAPGFNALACARKLKTAGAEAARTIRDGLATKARLDAGFDSSETVSTPALPLSRNPGAPNGYGKSGSG